MKQMIRSLAYQLTRKRICEDALPVREIKLRRNELSFFCLSTNPIISFTHEGQLWYFRECPRILPAEAYWNEAVDRFFDSLDRLTINKECFAQDIPIRISFDEEEISAFRKYIASKRSDRKFQTVMKNSDRIARQVHFSIWENQTYDERFFAAFEMNDLPEACRDIAVYFLWNMRTAACNFRLLHIAKGKQYSFFSASRAVASRIVAEMLDLEHLITPAIWCRLVIDDGQVLFGVISPCAPGCRMIDFALEPTASLQRELLCLNILDAICHQTDHGPNNYNVEVQNNGSCAVCAFDNDNPLTFFPWFSIHSTLSGCAPLVDIRNRIMRPHMDRRLAENLRCLDLAKLRLKLKPYLNELQIAAVNVRICRLNRAIANAQASNPFFLIDRSHWSTDSVLIEMSGQYGQTYLTKSVSVWQSKFTSKERKEN